MVDKIKESLTACTGAESIMLRSYCSLKLSRISLKTFDESTSRGLLCTTPDGIISKPSFLYRQGSNGDVPATRLDKPGEPFGKLNDTAKVGRSMSASINNTFSIFASDCAKLSDTVDLPSPGLVDVTIVIL